MPLLTELIFLRMPNYKDAAPTAPRFTAFAGSPPAAIIASALCWTIIYAQNTVKIIKLDGLHNAASMVC